MANGASRIFKFMQEAGTDTISEVVFLTVKSTNPLIFSLEDRLDITNDFYILSDLIIKSRINVGDKLLAFTFNNGQCYFIQQALDKNIKFQIIDNLTSNSIIDALSANQGRVLNGKIASMQSEMNSLKSRIETLESKI